MHERNPNVKRWRRSYRAVGQSQFQVRTGVPCPQLCAGMGCSQLKMPAQSCGHGTWSYDFRLKIRERITIFQWPKRLTRPFANRSLCPTIYRRLSHLYWRRGAEPRGSCCAAEVRRFQIRFPTPKPVCILRGNDCMAVVELVDDPAARRLTPPGALTASCPNCTVVRTA